MLPLDVVDAVRDPDESGGVIRGECGIDVGRPPTLPGTIGRPNGDTS